MPELREDINRLIREDFARYVREDSAKHDPKHDPDPYGLAKIIPNKELRQRARRLFAERDKLEKCRNLYLKYIQYAKTAPEYAYVSEEFLQKLFAQESADWGTRVIKLGDKIEEVMLSSALMEEEKKAKEEAEAR